MPTTFFIPNWFTYSDDRIIDVALDPKGIFIGCLYNEKDEKCHYFPLCLRVQAYYKISMKIDHESIIVNENKYSK